MDNPQDRVSKLLSDPESLKTIAKIASGLMSAQSEAGEAEKPEKSDGAAEPSSGQSAERADAEPTAAGIAEVNKTSSGAFSGVFGDFLAHADLDKSIGLLGALKPYLGNHKKETCDMLIKALGAAKLFGMYKG